ncbi:MAG TPA: hypothetical protein VKU41_12975 [Polyangiaceae bacterium]|nr:hypothetical protein [Polyangiaceae bacterium]
MASRVQPRTSWWKGFLESSFPPPAVPAPAGERTTRRRIGSACAVLSLAVVVCALAIGLHGAPPLSPRPPVIDAAIVIARAIMGLGMLGVGLSLLRIGEHLLLSRGPADERPRDSH